MTGTQLNEGGGLCRPEAQLEIFASQEALELGAGLDAMAAAFKSLHALNRHAGGEGYLAAALPQFGQQKSEKPGGGLRCGSHFVAVGSKRAIEALAGFDVIRRSVLRGLIDPCDPEEIFVEEGDTCAAWYRDRRPERATPAGRKRRAQRHERLGYTPFEEKAFSSFTGSYASMKIGKVTTFVGMTKGIWTGEEIRVSTYGLCSRTAPAFLPVAVEADEALVEEAA